MRISVIWICAVPAIAATALLPAREPSSPAPPPSAETAARRDAELVRGLLDENLAARRFSFAVVAEACSGKKVQPLDESEPHRRVVAAIESAISGTIMEHNREDSPVRALRRINEASRFFEDGIRERINAMQGFRCDFPPTRASNIQRAGYPDLRIVDEKTGTVFYLDPKLVQQGSEAATFRTFYFEPKDGTLKITEDAVHLLAGIEHDGKNREWTFLGWRLVDLSTLSVRLKAEFQASNADLYRETALSLPDTRR